MASQTLTKKFCPPKPLNTLWLYLITFSNVQRDAKINCKQDTMLLGLFPGIGLRFISSHLLRKEALNLRFIMISIVASEWQSTSWACWWHPVAHPVYISYEEHHEVSGSLSTKTRIVCNHSNKPRTFWVGAALQQGCICFWHYFQITWKGSQGAGTAKVRITSLCVQTMFVCQPLKPITFSVQSGGLQPWLKWLDWGFGPLLCRP